MMRTPTRGGVAGGDDDARRRMADRAPRLGGLSLGGEGEELTGAAAAGAGAAWPATGAVWSIWGRGDEEMIMGEWGGEEEMMMGELEVMSVECLHLPGAGAGE